MTFDFVNNIAVCKDMVAAQAPINLLYYSHIPAAILSVFIGLYVFFKDRTSLAAKFLLGLTLAFSLWATLDLAIWLYAFDSEFLMMAWSSLGILYCLIYVFSLYFTYAYFDRSLPPFSTSIILLFLFLPVLILTPTFYNIESFDLVNCVANEGKWFTNYYYFFGFVVSMWLLAVAYRRYLRSDTSGRKQIIFFTIGIELFLSMFFSVGFFVSFLVDSGYIPGDYTSEMYGLFGMPIFIALLAYLIVRYRAFNIKLVLAQALVIGMIILIASQFAFIQIPINKILNAITLVLVAFFGLWLARSVKKEVEQRERLEHITEQLRVANEQLKELDQQKTDFLSIASHQLRTPLTIFKGFIELIHDGAYGKAPKQMIPVLNDFNYNNEHLIKLVDEFLNASRIEQGRTKWEFKNTNINQIIGEVTHELATKSDKKGITLQWHDNSAPISAVIDREKIYHVIFNFVDNAIKYSDRGKVVVSLSQEKNGFAVRVKDNGIGFGADDKGKFFQKFYRGQNTKNTVNVTGTGLGIYICKRFVEGHGGRVWAISDGPGKGSEFGFWIPFEGRREGVVESRNV